MYVYKNRRSVEHARQLKAIERAFILDELFLDSYHHEREREREWRERGGERVEGERGRESGGREREREWREREGERVEGERVEGERGRESGGRKIEFSQFCSYRIKFSKDSSTVMKHSRFSCKQTFEKWYLSALAVGAGRQWWPRLPARLGPHCHWKYVCMYIHIIYIYIFIYTYICAAVCSLNMHIYLFPSRLAVLRG